MNERESSLVLEWTTFVSNNNNLIETARLTKILSYKGIDRVQLDEAQAGDIVAIAGLQKATVSHTICSPEIKKSIATDANSTESSPKGN